MENESKRRRRNEQIVVMPSGKWMSREHYERAMLRGRIMQMVKAGFLAREISVELEISDRIVRDIIGRDCERRERLERLFNRRIK